jgi:hypothetical protein
MPIQPAWFPVRAGKAGRIDDTGDQQPGTMPTGLAAFACRASICGSDATAVFGRSVAPPPMRTGAAAEQETSGCCADCFLACFP